MAVNVVVDPVHVGLLPIVIAVVTDGTNVLFTTIVIALEVPVVGLTHVALLVMTQVTTSPLFNVVEVYKGLFTPTFTPFTFHW